MASKDPAFDIVAEYLDEYVLLSRRLNRLECKLQREVHNIRGPGDIKGVDYSGQPSAHFVSNTFDDLTKLTELNNEIADIQSTINEAEETLRLVDKRPGDVLGKILSLSYLQSYRVPEIAEELGFSIPRVNELKKEAVHKFLVILQGKKACKSPYIISSIEK